MTGVAKFWLLLVLCCCLWLFGIGFSTNSAQLFSIFVAAALVTPSSLRLQNREKKLKKKSGGSHQRAASYARYSSQLQRSDSIDQQQQKCQEAAEANGHTISPELKFADKAVSGTKLSRAGLNSLIEAAKEGEWSSPRIVRSIKSVNYL